MATLLVPVYELLKVTPLFEWGLRRKRGYAWHAIDGRQLYARHQLGYSNCVLSVEGVLLVYLIMPLVWVVGCPRNWSEVLNYIAGFSIGFNNGTFSML